jgi:hypothetical protein
LLIVFWLWIRERWWLTPRQKSLKRKRDRGIYGRC